MPITSKQRAQLRGLAMHEDTIIQIGKGGITEAVVESVNAALRARLGETAARRHFDLTETCRRTAELYQRSLNHGTEKTEI